MISETDFWPRTIRHDVVSKFLLISPISLKAEKISWTQKQFVLVSIKYFSSFQRLVNVFVCGRGGGQAMNSTMNWGILRGLNETNYTMRGVIEIDKLTGEPWMRSFFGLRTQEIEEDEDGKRVVSVNDSIKWNKQFFTQVLSSPDLPSDLLRRTTTSLTNGRLRIPISRTIKSNLDRPTKGGHLHNSIRSYCQHRAIPIRSH